MPIFIFNTHIKSLTGKFKRNIDDGEILNITYDDKLYRYGLMIDDKKVLWDTFTKSLSDKFNTNFQLLSDGYKMLEVKVEKIRYGIKLFVVSAIDKPKQISL